ncbi:hypothetical protein ACFQ0M_08125 [Kitasatospora aburaviensis]
MQTTQSVPLPAASGAWWLPALSPAERDALPPGRTPRWAELVEQALRLAESAPGGRIRSLPGTGPEGRLLHPLLPFLRTTSATSRRRTLHRQSGEWCGPVHGATWPTAWCGWPDAHWYRSWGTRAGPEP